MEAGQWGRLSYLNREDVCLWLLGRATSTAWAPNTSKQVLTNACTHVCTQPSTFSPSSLLPFLCGISGLWFNELLLSPHPRLAYQSLQIVLHVSASSNVL